MADEKGYEADAGLNNKKSGISDADECGLLWACWEQNGNMCAMSPWKA